MLLGCGFGVGGGHLAALQGFEDTQLWNSLHFLLAPLFTVDDLIHRLTAQAFESALPGLGGNLLLVCVLFFSISTMFGYSYYGCKCAGFLFGTGARKYYNLFYIVTLGVAAMASLNAVINLLDGMFALMAIPTMTASLLLAPRVMKAARTYFAKFGSPPGVAEETRPSG